MNHDAARRRCKHAVPSLQGEVRAERGGVLSLTGGNAMPASLKRATMTEGSPGMTAERLDLSMALSDNDRTRPIVSGQVGIEGVVTRTTVVHPSEMFWRSP